MRRTYLRLPRAPQDVAGGPVPGYQRLCRVVWLSAAGRVAVSDPGGALEVGTTRLAGETAHEPPSAGRLRSSPPSAEEELSLIAGHALESDIL